MTLSPERPRTETPETPPIDRSAIALITPVTLALAALASLWWAHSTGLSARSALVIGVMLGIGQVLPGVVLWRAARPRNGWLLEDVVIGFAVGAGLGVAAQVIAGLSRMRWLSLALPLLVAGVVLAVPVTRQRVRTARWTSVPWWTGPGLVLATWSSIPQLRFWYDTNKLNWGSGIGAPHIDAYLHVALAGEILNRGPAAWPTVAGEDLGYHWFTHAWVAHVSATSGGGLDEILLRFMPAVMPLSVGVAVWAVVMRLVGRSGVGVLAAALCMSLGPASMFASGAPWLPIEPASPTLAMGAFPLLALVSLLAMRWRGELLPGSYYLIPFMMTFATGTKGSTGPLVVAGLAVAALAMLLFQRSKLKPLTFDLAVSVVCLVLVMKLVFHGSSAGLAFNVDEAAHQTELGGWLSGAPGLGAALLISGLTVALNLARAAGLFVLPFDRVSRPDPVIWLLLGGSIAGTGAIGVFSHPGRSQYYFFRTALPLMAIGGALGLTLLWHAVGRQRALRIIPVALMGAVAAFYLPVRLIGPIGPGDPARLIAITLVGIAIGLITLVVSHVVGRRSDPSPASRDGGKALSRALGPVVFAAAVALTASCALAAVSADGSPVEPAPRKNTADYLATTQSQLDAARFIRDHSGVDDLVMTNRHCTKVRPPFNGCDSRRWVVTAFSERQSLVEGWTATPEATRLAPHGRDSITINYWKPDVLRLNDGFYTHPTEEARARLWNLGVRWVYVDKPSPHAKSLGPYATLRFDGRDAQAWQLNPPTTG